MSDKRKSNIGIRFNDGDKYPFVFDVETGNELRGIIRIEFSADAYEDPSHPRVYIVADAGLFDFEGLAMVEQPE